MKIYFAAATSSGRKYLKQSMRIVNICKKLGNRILSENIVDPNLQKKKSWMKDWNAKKLYQRERKKVRESDLIIAEVSAPSLGTGLLIEYALNLKKPVLALFYKDNDAKLSLMVKGHPELYLENYSKDSIETVLRVNLKYFESRRKTLGRLIVIDGTNGSGKATQTKLLLKFLKRNKIKSNYISFPRYYTSFHGKTVARFLTGEFGALEKVNPYLSSLIYALDRLTAKDQILDWLRAGRVVVADRYITSSLAHQAVKVSRKERQKIQNWLYDMEYKQHKMPKEDIVIYLYVPPEISDKLILQKAKKYKGKKKRDIEEGLVYQRKVFRLYVELSKKYKHWVMIKCINGDGKLRTRQDIHEEMVEVLRKRKIIQVKR